jgi:hypothetical protein
MKRKVTKRSLLFKALNIRKIKSINTFLLENLSTTDTYFFPIFVNENKKVILPTFALVITWYIFTQKI